MRLRFSVLTPFLLTGLLGAPALAQQPPQTPPVSSEPRDHLSYYTYYKTVEGETVAGVAAKFGLVESSLVRMNPYLTQYGDDLPTGTLVCVPKEQTRSSSGLLAGSERQAAAKPRAEQAEKAAAEAAQKAKNSKPATASAKPSGKNQKAAPKVETDWPSEAEWEKLAELCTKGAPPPPQNSSMVISAPPSRFIGSDGRVTLVPAAKPKPAPQPKRVADTSRGELTSRKGKAIHTVVMTARSYMGVPYVWGGEDPSGFDCSGFIQYVYGKHGIRLPRTADIQFNVGTVVKRGDEKPGDLVFFETYYPGPSHVGIYLGRDYFLHASSSRGVTTDRLSSDFFAQRYLGAKRNF